MSKNNIEETKDINKEELGNNDNYKLDSSFKDVFKNSDKLNEFKTLTKEQIENLKNKLEQEFNLEATVEGVNIKFSKKRVVFVDGKEQLVYDDGEFYIEDAVDSKKVKKKITKQKAMERYIEFFVRYTLNPLIEEKRIDDITKQIIKVNDKKEKTIRTKTEKIKQIKEKKQENKAINTVEKENINKKEIPVDLKNKEVTKEEIVR